MLRGCALWTSPSEKVTANLSGELLVWWRSSDSMAAAGRKNMVATAVAGMRMQAAHQTCPASRPLPEASWVR